MSTELRTPDPVTPAPPGRTRVLLTDVRLAADLVRGSGRRAGWRLGLIAFGAFLATWIALAARTVAAIPDHHPVRYSNGLLNGSGVRPGLVLALVLLLVPVLAFVGQATRIGAVHRERRFAALRLSGATARQVRTVAALEAGLTCLLGSASGLVTFLLARLAAGTTPQPGRVQTWPSDVPVSWPGFVLITLGVPLLATAAGALALRRVATSPLGVFRRTRPPRRPWVYALMAVLLVAGVGLAFVGSREDLVATSAVPALAAGSVILLGAGAVTSAGAAARFLGNRLVARAQRPAVLIAAGRLQSDPWAGARVHATVLLVTVVGVGFTGIRLITLEQARREVYAADTGFYESGFAAVGLTVLAALSIALLGLAVGTAESLITRRRALAAQAAAGVPIAVLRRAVLLETALPLAPAVLLAGLGGLLLYGLYTLAFGAGIPLLQPLLVPVGVYGACLLATAISLPLLATAVRPTELRYE